MLNTLITVLRYLELGQQVTFEGLPPLEMGDNGRLYFVLEREDDDVLVNSELTYNYLLELTSELTEEQLVGMRGTLALTKERRRNAR